MAKIAPAFFDNARNSHATPEDAVASDIATALGRVGDTGITPGLAKLILDRREAIERAFADLDEMAGAAA